MMLFARPAGVRYRFLPPGPAGLLPWLIAALAFIAGLAVIGALTLDSAAAQLQAGASGRATVQVVTADPRLREAQTVAALQLLQRDPAIAAAQELPRAEIERLLRPWLGAGVTVHDLPLPAMIDVTLSDPAALPRLKAGLAKAAPLARLDLHSDWIGGATRTLRALQGLSIAIVLLVLGATAAIVALAVRASLDSTRATVELLHMMGAEDRGVSAIFEHRSFQQALAGGLTGCVGAGVAASALSSGAAGLTVPLAAWAALVLLPVAVALLAGAAARLGVRAALRAMP